jgi:putative transposase
MSIYHRFYKKGGPYFFTVITYRRQQLLQDEKVIGFLREAFRVVMDHRPFAIEAIMILPDYLHCIWQLPPGDDDFSTRWVLIKKHVSTRLNSAVNLRGEKCLWQWRFWEHWIREEADRQRHMDYIHYNPVKHGYFGSPSKWQHSSFKQAVAKGLYDEHWGAYEPPSIRGLHYE